MRKIRFRERLYSIIAPILLVCLNTLFAMVRIFAEGWRGWVGLSLAGAFLLAGYTVIQPPLYRSEGVLTITPRYLLEGYMLATQELTHHYAARLIGDQRIARAMAAAGTEIEPTVEATSHAGMMVELVVEHPNQAVTEALNRALLVDLRDEILRENRTRGENDRLTVAVSPTSFAHPTAPDWQWYGALGALGGFVLGVLWIYAMAFWWRGRLRNDGDVRQSVGLPLLGMIPRQR